MESSEPFEAAHTEECASLQSVFSGHLRLGGGKENPEAPLTVIALTLLPRGRLRLYSAQERCRSGRFCMLVVDCVMGASAWPPSQDLFLSQGSLIKESLVSTGAECLSCATWTRVPEFAQ